MASARRQHGACFARSHARATAAAHAAVPPRPGSDGVDDSRAHVSRRPRRRLVASRPSGCPSRAACAGRRPHPAGGPARGGRCRAHPMGVSGVAIRIDRRRDRASRCARPRHRAPERQVSRAPGGAIGTPREDLRGTCPRRFSCADLEHRRDARRVGTLHRSEARQRWRTDEPPLVGNWMRAGAWAHTARKDRVQRRIRSSVTIRTPPGGDRACARPPPSERTGRP